MLKSSPIVINDEDNELELKYDWSKFDYFDFPKKVSKIPPEKNVCEINL